MIHKYLIRYVIFALALLLCAGVAWYLTNAGGDPRGDVVLVYSEAAAAPIQVYPMRQ